MLQPLRRLALWRTIGLALLLGSLLSFTAPAQAAEGDGQWYIDHFQIKDFHARGIDGTGVTIAVVDTAINLDVPELQGANIVVKEPSQCYGPGGAEQSSVSDDPALAFHGTNMVADIVGNGTGYDGQSGITGIAPKAKILFYSLGSPGGVCASPPKVSTGVPSLVWSEMVSDAIVDATDQGADIISVSIVSAGGLLDDALAYAMHRGVIVVAGLQNQTSSDDLLANMDGKPAVNNGVVSVGAFDGEGKVLINGMGKSSTSSYVDVVAPGADILTRGDETDWHAQTLAKGNSFATAITAGNLALAIQKYPAATHNQIIQSLIHNTGTAAHELQYDKDRQYGYGAVDTISLLAADPTQYEDVNPLLVEGALIGPTPQQVLAGLSASPSPSASADPTTQPTATPTPAPNPDDGSSSPVMWLLVGGAVLLLILIGVGITIAVASSKPKHTGSQ